MLIHDPYQRFALWGNAAIVLTMAVATAITYQAGGTTTSFPHLYYVPVIIGAFLYGLPGGVVSGFIAGVLCGPWMPQVVDLGLTQSPENWLVRTVFFVGIGALAGVLIGALRGRIMALHELNEQILRAFVQAIDAKDRYTGEHSTRVAEFAEAIARELGLPAADVERVRRSALLHDVGKIGVPEHILQKPGRLTPEEFRIIQQHPVQSAQIISWVDEFRAYIGGVRHHHERLDGMGYPDGLKGAEIPLDARIIAVADAFEAMTSDRAYREALPEEEALRRLREGAGTQFCPDVVAAFERVAARLNKGVADRPMDGAATV